MQVGSTVYFQPAHNSATKTELLLPEVVLIQFFSPDNEHYVVETGRVINKYIIHQWRLFFKICKLHCLIETSMWLASLHTNVCLSKINIRI